MKRLSAFAYGLACYAVFFGTFLYAAAWMGNFGVPNSIDSEPHGSPLHALAVNLALLSAFALQHSIMARRWFKRAWTRIVPEPVERSTYVLFSSLALILMFWQWQPIGGVIWDTRGSAMEMALIGTYAAGLLIVLLSTFLINHFDLFGLRQVYLYLRGKCYTHLQFRTPFFYKFVRHPLYVGWLLSFWSAPVMTSAHLLFALITTAYILIAIRFEERDLIAIHGETYRQYRERTPMIVPSMTPVADLTDAPRLERAPATR